MTVDGAFIQKLRNDFFSGRTVIGKICAAQTVFFIGKQVIQRNYGILPGPQTYCGLSKVGKTYLYVSPGLGDNDGLYPPPFFRLFNPPTISLISLTTSRL